MTNPIAEYFGFPPSNTTPEVQKIRKQQICPFIGIKCDKTSQHIPGLYTGVCSIIYSKTGKPIIVCPKRFMFGDFSIEFDIAKLTSFDSKNVELIPEKTLKTKASQNLGRVDYFLVLVDPKNRTQILDLAAIEIQGVNITATVTEHMIELINKLEIFPHLDRDVQTRIKNYRRRSSTRVGFNLYDTVKNIYTQLLRKSAAFELWDKKTFLVCQDTFLEDLKGRYHADFEEGIIDKNSIVIVTYKLLYNEEQQKYGLKQDKVYSTSQRDMLAAAFNIDPNELPDLDEFKKMLSQELKRGKKYVRQKGKQSSLSSLTLGQYSA